MLDRLLGYAQRLFPSGNWSWDSSGRHSGPIQEKAAVYALPHTHQGKRTYGGRVVVMSFVALRERWLSSRVGATGGRRLTAMVTDDALRVPGKPRRGGTSENPPAFHFPEPTPTAVTDHALFRWYIARCSLASLPEQTGQ
jgi:hypothetical protein